MKLFAPTEPLAFIWIYTLVYIFHTKFENSSLLVITRLVQYL